MEYQRDKLISKIYSEATKNKDIYFISADFGAPALDIFREKLPKQFIHSGISEQNSIDLAAGLALDGRIVFVYAMAPFVTLRCLEQHKCSTGIMKLPVCTIVAGIGLGYADAGPTHYATEDLSCLNSLINSNVSTASDPLVAEYLGQNFIENPSYSFIRLDRHPTPIIDPKFEYLSIKKGYRPIESKGDICVISHGGILNNVIAARQFTEKSFAICDLFRTKPVSHDFIEFISSYKTLVTVDEQSTGGLSSILLESLNEHKILKNIINLKLPEKYFFENGGRDYLLDKSNLSPEKIAQELNKI